MAVPGAICKKACRKTQKIYFNQMQWLLISASLAIFSNWTTGQTILQMVGIPQDNNKTSSSTAGFFTFFIDS